MEAEVPECWWCSLGYQMPWGRGGKWDSELLGHSASVKHFEAVLIFSGRLSSPPPQRYRRWVFVPFFPSLRPAFSLALLWYMTCGVVGGVVLSLRGTEKIYFSVGMSGLTFPVHVDFI